MKTIKGPAVFLAQFVDSKAPFNSLDGMCKWAADLGYKGIQIPTWEHFLIDLDKAAESQTYCDELKGTINSYGLEITELSTHIQGQLVAVHPAYDTTQCQSFPNNHVAAYLFLFEINKLSFQRNSLLSKIVVTDKNKK